MTLLQPPGLISRQKANRHLAAFLFLGTKKPAGAGYGGSDDRESASLGAMALDVGSGQRKSPGGGPGLMISC